jgi:hypothetical protein
MAGIVGLEYRTVGLLTGMFLVAHGNEINAFVLQMTLDKLPQFTAVAPATIYTRNAITTL